MIEHEILTNGITVWINGGPTGGLLGRFGPTGIDVHGALSQSCADGFCDTSQCPPWEVFVQKVHEIHGIEVQISWRPKWARPRKRA